MQYLLMIYGNEAGMSSAQTDAVERSMGRIRPSNSATTPEIQRSRIAPPAISLLRRNAEPFINSAITMMLVKRSPSPMPRFQLRTRSSA